MLVSINVRIWEINGAFYNILLIFLFTFIGEAQEIKKEDRKISPLTAAPHKSSDYSFTFHLFSVFFKSIKFSVIT